MIYAGNSRFNSAILLNDFSSNGYTSPLKLEDGKPNTFLESTFEITNDNTIRHWLKNDNEQGAPPTIWRYSHFNSYATFESKKAILIATLKKLDKMSSDQQSLLNSAVQKLSEFIDLNYPAKLIWTACTTLAVTTRDTTWFKIRGIALNRFPRPPHGMCAARWG